MSSHSKRPTNVLRLHCLLFYLFLVFFLLLHPLFLCLLFPSMPKSLPLTFLFVWSFVSFCCYISFPFSFHCSFFLSSSYCSHSISDCSCFSSSYYNFSSSIALFLLLSPHPPSTAHSPPFATTALSDSRLPSTSFSPSYSTALPLPYSSTVLPPPFQTTALSDSPFHLLLSLLVILFLSPPGPQVTVTTTLRNETEEGGEGDRAREEGKLWH